MAISKRFIQLLGEIEELHKKKNAGYAGVDEKDPFRNFRFSKMFGISPLKGVMVRMSDKYVRTSNLIKNMESEQVGESLVDTLMDLAAYALIAVCLCEEEIENNKKEKR